MKVNTGTTELTLQDLTPEHVIVVKWCGDWCILVECKNVLFALYRIKNFTWNKSLGDDFFNVWIKYFKNNPHVYAYNSFIEMRDDEELWSLIKSEK